MASNRYGASAKSSTALTVLARETMSGLPLLPSIEPPSRLDTLLNASPASLLNSLRMSLRFGQFTSSWVTVSCAPFAVDALRLELVGNSGPHPTIVDLPGLKLFAEYEEDVKSYRPSATLTPKGIIQRARHFDEDGLRTVGIITKLNPINTGTEARITRLANTTAPNSNLDFGPEKPQRDGAQGGYDHGRATQNGTSLSFH
ncbi:uncharacterized protein N7529_007108 [Penicillium soppii]|uniref:uncharacterized protein n=1 Tax=Penicillium soppii TaxID=69789 RepID=UPI002546D999|nr:uncharacterized protein N7529_007108 [Penicillium soppii]KAJ5865192.1 hypothetical protein N7529_007108 [Penicillium soppii]